MKNQLTVTGFILLLLIAGGGIYIFSRTDETYFRHAVVLMGFTPQFQLPLPAWMKYVLPDVFWMASLSLTMLLIWNFKLHRQSILWCLSALLAGLLMETGQKFQWVSGTFDLQDVLGMSFGWLIPVSVVYLKRTIWKTN